MQYKNGVSTRDQVLHQDADAIVFLKLRQQQVDGMAAPKFPETQ